MPGEAKYTIGREKACDIPIADDSVSRLHAEISLSDRAQIVLTDLRSQNGTVILRDGKTIEVRTEILQPTDEVRFGSITLAARDIIQTIERKKPGALSVARPQHPSPGHGMPGGPPAPPPGIAFGAQPAPGRLVRCDCGAVKTIGQPCPGCHR